jgi:hypothetical protein
MNTKTLITIAMAATAFVTVPTLAETSSSGEKLICRDVELTGSRLPKKVCRTYEQWKSVIDIEAPSQRKVKKERLAKEKATGTPS